jgi:hypothetical protein
VAGIVPGGDRVGQRGWVFCATTFTRVSFSCKVDYCDKESGETAGADIRDFVCQGSLALLYSVWGYEVDQGEAWCDQAFRAGMACVSGTDTLASLMAHGLPWIAALEIDNTHIPVVIIGGGAIRSLRCRGKNMGSE